MPLVIGGSGGPRSLRIAARWASEYNTVFAGPERIAELRGKLDAACEKRRPRPGDAAALGDDRAGSWGRPARRSSTAPRGCRPGRGRATTARPSSPEANDAWIVGTVEEAVEQLRALHEAGCTRVMAQHLLHRDIEAIELIGREVAPLIERF